LWKDVHAGYRIWIKPDWINYRTKGQDLPPLVTTSPVGTPQTEAGVLGEPDTSILFGNQEVDEDRRNGGRIDFGYWLVDGEFVGVSGHYFILEEDSTTFSESSVFSEGPTADRILARPFFNFDPAVLAPDSALIAFPDFQIDNPDGSVTIVDLDGSIDIRTSVDVQSAGAMITNLLWIDFTTNWRVDFLSGYRFFKLDDSIEINDRFTTVGGVLAPTTFESTDRFEATNEFHGGEVGLKGQAFYGRFSLELLSKIAFGNNHQEVDISGSNSVTTLGQTVTTEGGLLALPTNIGEHTRNQFTILPEAGMTFRFELTKNVRLSAGYSFIYVDKVLRSAEQIDLGVNTTQIGGTLVGDPRPAFFGRDDSFWVRGVTAGFELRY
jgi:hypothetical protein